MSETLQQLFVYGSLRSGFQHPAYEYISRYFTLLGNAKVKGRLYNMGDFPAAVPTTDDVFIVGELYQVKQADEFAWAISQLDDYEGVQPEPGEIAFYKRDKASIYFNDTITEAWIYWYTQPTTGKEPIASGDILEFLQQKNA